MSVTTKSVQIIDSDGNTWAFADRIDFGDQGVYIELYESSGRRFIMRESDTNAVIEALQGLASGV